VMEETGGQGEGGKVVTTCKREREMGGGEDKRPRARTKKGN